MHNLLADFDVDFAKLLRLRLREFEKGAIEEIGSLLLSKALLKYFDFLPRFVVQSERNDCPPPYGQEYYRYVMPEIGIINGMRLFFQVINNFTPAVNLHREKVETKTNPPTIVSCNKTQNLIRAILANLDSRDLSKPNELITVPAGFFVFEFVAGEGTSFRSVGRRRGAIVTVDPFSAKSINEAIRTLMLWPMGSGYSDLSRFRVCTNKGWLNLRSKTRPHVERRHASLRDYIISPN